MTRELLLVAITPPALFALYTFAFAAILRRRERRDPDAMTRRALAEVRKRVAEGEAIHAPATSWLAGLAWRRRGGKVTVEADDGGGGERFDTQGELREPRPISDDSCR